jgi:hypothetical protein
MLNGTDTLINAKSYRPMSTASRHILISSSELVEGTYFMMGGTVTISLDRWNHRMHISGKYTTGAGRWSWFMVIGKNNTKMIYITCYRVCHQPPICILGSAYYQQYHIMEQENKSFLLPLDPHCKTIRDLKICMLQKLNDGYTVNLAIYGNESDTHLYRPPKNNIRITTTLGFNYDSQISGSITEMI